MMKKTILRSCFCVMLLSLWAASVGAQTTPIVIENTLFRYEIAPDGRNIAFSDKATGANLLSADKPTYCIAAVTADGTQNPVGVTFDQGILAARFTPDGAVKAEVRVTVQPQWIKFEVVAVSDAVTQLNLLDMPLTTTGTLADPFAACAMALDLQTNIAPVPGPQKHLLAQCYREFGLEGAETAIVAAPVAQLRDIMKEVVAAAPDLPQPAPGTQPIGGPWALDAEAGRGSYLFDFGALTEETVDQWIETVKKLGLNQIDFHTGTSLRFGDCAPNPKLFPRGRASVKAVIDRLHAAGISAGLHTYAFFIAKDAPYITPVPDSRLGKAATLTLAADLSADANALLTEESTEKMSTITGFFVHNSVTLQIDDELITFNGVNKAAPFGFAECTRGAYGTKAAVHAKGAKVHHLKECFGLFTPDANSTMLAEVAENTASTFNECGFDMIYLDALDGEGILGGSDKAWHYGSKFVFEIAKRLKKPALFEMSTFHHHLWYVRARMGAWDHPARSHKRFIDLHVAANQEGAGMYLPMNLGWWAVKTWGEDPQTEPTYPDDIEYLMGKCLGNDMSLSLMGVNPDTLKSVPAYQRLAPIIQQYEDLRHTDYFLESVKKRLRVPGDEFTLEHTADNAWRFRQVIYDKHKVTGMEEAEKTWTVNNRFGNQPIQLRIEPLYSVAPYDAPNAVVLADLAAEQAAFTSEGATGVSMTLSGTNDDVKAGGASGCVLASNTVAEPNGAWARLVRKYEPVVNAKDQQAIGVWVKGAGSGAVINLQKRSPEHTTFGGLGDHYIKDDFTGWRYFEMVEPEAANIANYRWPYSGSAYGIYRETVDPAQIEKLSVWMNMLPKGQEARVLLSPIKALPLVKQKLVNPSITIGAKTITFPVELETGYTIEFRSMDDCKVYGHKGELIAEIKPEGSVPELVAGDNTVSFGCSVPADGLRPRAYVTLSVKGDLI